ncbi:hypothetical protein AALP_AA7G126300 [Arabis alpina]|uniref:Uncharacterized protein n=1 Tax=Arabis alpina TaxID=50452 RepID=A0A087GHN0_ARAAL|nr:hypothetical protein AALP_AA7G126300 [Arabis alpina]
MSSTASVENHGGCRENRDLAGNKREDNVACRDLLLDQREAEAGQRLGGEEVGSKPPDYWKSSSTVRLPCGAVSVSGGKDPCEEHVGY